mmetsp:Transcript_3035/g.6583  ORF Transcript_3035/g.6583 Transcript_3035/m.6583 type:complete len:203 (-) Transcript_3035:246-854(-)
MKQRVLGPAGLDVADMSGALFKINMRMRSAATGAAHAGASLVCWWAWTVVLRMDQKAAKQVAQVFPPPKGYPKELYVMINNRHCLPEEILSFAAERFASGVPEKAVADLLYYTRFALDKALRAAAEAARSAQQQAAGSIGGSSAGAVPAPAGSSLASGASSSQALGSAHPGALLPLEAAVAVGAGGGCCQPAAGRGGARVWT